jgi:diadenosine tetraphosphatase ApaH/serine/threonine PP2A family protein phosphatase
LSAEQREFLRRLPRAIEGELVGTRGEAGVWFHAEHNLPGASRYVRHDTPEDEIAPLIVQAEAQLFLFGHTHTVIDRVVAGKRIVNPGSVGQPRDGCPHAAFAVWENGTLEFRRVAYDVARTVQALEATPLSVKQKQMWARNLQEGIVIAESRPDLEASGLV